VTGQQGMFTVSRHLILPLVFPGVLVSLIFTRLFHEPDLDTDLIADFFRYLAGLTNFDGGLF
jgi:hypothetical protein